MLNNPYINNDLIPKSLEKAFGLGVVSDMNGKAGIEFEAAFAEDQNEFLSQTHHTARWVTQQILQRLWEDGTISIHQDDLHTPEETHKEFFKSIKSVDSPYLASDLFLISDQKGEVRILDSFSNKSAISKSPEKVSLYNDPDGVIYDQIDSGDYNASLGNVLLEVMNTQTGENEIYYASGNVTMRDLISEGVDFIVEKNSKGNLQFKTQNPFKLNKDGSVNKTKTIAVELFYRGKKKKDDDSKSTSFARGIHFKVWFLKMLADRGVVERVSNANLVDVKKIEKERFAKVLC
jgi:hypothetical protein